ncbi:MAG: prohibitin family protein [Chloroflexi bacterium]|nr:prohibitin family protein [Chloroflexota bacterium]
MANDPGGRARRSALPTPSPQARRGCLTGALALGGGLIVVLLLSLFLSSATVQAGYVGLVLTFGRVEPVTLQPGFHLVMPIVQRIVQVDVRVLPHTFKDIDAASRELQSVKLSGTMNYHLDPARAAMLYQTVGLDFADKVIDPAFADFVKEVVPQYAVTDILTKRDEIRAKAREKLAANLDRYGIVIDDIYISNITFSPDYQSAIERKQTAQQNVETEQQILRQKEIQAQQTIVDAKGRAEAAVAAAEGEARANLARAASITPQLIEYLRWTRWDGRLPMVNGGATPLITLPPEAPSGAPASGSTAAPAAPAAPAPAPTVAAPRPAPTATPTARP